MKCRYLAAAVLALMLMLCSSALAIEYVAKATSGGAVYAKSDTSSKQIATLPKDEYFVLYSVSGDWAKICLNGKTCYTKASNVKKTSRAAYVTSGYVDVYESWSTSSKKMSVLGYGTEIKVTARNDGWAEIKSGSKTGYCKASALGYDNPNGSGTKVYPQKYEITVYQYPSSSAESKTVSYGTTLTYLCTYNDWCRVKKGDNIGYVKKSDIGTTKYDGYSTATPATAASKSVDWFKSSISSLFAKGTDVIVTDVKTGISWKVRRTGGLYHVDAEPLTEEDTRAMKKACGSDFNTWHRRAVWVSIGSQKYAASINCMPHGSCKLHHNGFDGVFCIHFLNSKTHCSEKVDGDHQAMISAALRAG